MDNLAPMCHFPCNELNLSKSKNFHHLIFLSDMPLKKLDLSGTHNQNFTMINDHRNLEELIIRNQQVREINIRSTKIK